MWPFNPGMKNVDCQILHQFNFVTSNTPFYCLNSFYHFSNGTFSSKIRCVDCRWFPTKVIRIWPWVVVSVIRNFYRLCSTLFWPNSNFFFSEAISNSRTLNKCTLRVICRYEFDSWNDAQNIWKVPENKGFF